LYYVSKRIANNTEEIAKNNQKYVFEYFECSENSESISYSFKNLRPAARSIIA